MKTIKEILELILEEFESEDNFYSGLCYTNASIYFNKDTNLDEYMMLSKYIREHVVLIHKGYGWCPSDKLSRIDWLKKHIELNSK